MPINQEDQIVRIGLDPVSSRAELVDFAKSYVWQDIHNYLSSQVEDAIKHLKTESDILEIKQIQGYIQCAEDLLTIPEQMIEWVDINKAVELMQGDDDE